MLPGKRVWMDKHTRASPAPPARARLRTPNIRACRPAPDSILGVDCAPLPGAGQRLADSLGQTLYSATATSASVEADAYLAVGSCLPVHRRIPTVEAWRSGSRSWSSMIARRADRQSSAAGPAGLSSGDDALGQGPTVTWSRAPDWTSWRMPSPSWASRNRREPPGCPNHGGTISASTVSGRVVSS